RPANRASCKSVGRLRLCPERSVYGDLKPFVRETVTTNGQVPAKAVGEELSTSPTGVHAQRDTYAQVLVPPLIQCLDRDLSQLAPDHDAFASYETRGIFSPTGNGGSACLVR